VTKLIGKLAILPLVAGSIILAFAASAQADDKNPTAKPTSLARPSASASAHTSDDDKSGSTTRPTSAPTARPTEAPEPRPTGVPMPKPTGVPGNDGDESAHHIELHTQYGDDVDKIFLPPLVVKGSSQTPSKIGSQLVPPTGSDTNLPQPPLGILKDATRVDPTANLPINPDATLVTDKTPADTFFQQATFGLAIMAVGAIGLGSVAVIQRRSHRLDSQDTYTAN